MKRFVILFSLACVALLDAGAVVRAQSGDFISDLDLKVVKFADLEYPPAAKRARVQGAVVVRVQIDAGGSVREAQALAGNPALVPAAVANAKQWRFQPNPRGAAILIYDFTLETGACYDDSHSFFMQKHGNLVTISACAPVLQG